jgi:hypothetical protein
MKILSIFAVLLLIYSCKKEEGGLSISGFLLTDAFGNVITSKGPVADDWQLSPGSSLSVKEKSFLDFADTTGVEHTGMTTINVYPSYPNPVVNASTITVKADDSVLLKLVIVNNEGEVLVRHERKIKGYYSVMSDVSDRSRFPAGRPYRYYYAFSAEGHPMFLAGHGDIKVCERSNIDDCF